MYFNSQFAAIAFVASIMSLAEICNGLFIGFLRSWTELPDDANNYLSLVIFKPDVELLILIA